MFRQIKMDQDQGRVHDLMPKQIMNEAEGYYMERLQTLSLYANRISDTRFLSICQFPYLLSLNLQTNHIHNLGALMSHINFPCLQTLKLGTNHITSLRGCKRWWFSSLNCIELEFNQITDIRNLFEAHMPLLFTLHLYYNKIGDMTPLFKCNHRRLESILLEDNHTDFDWRIKQAIISTKFPYAQFFD